MRLVLWSFLIVSLCCAGGCVDRRQKTEEVVKPGATVIFYPTDANALLRCVAENKALTRKGHKEAIQKGSEQLEGGAGADKLRFVCLSAHEYATYKQFKTGMEILEQYGKDNPDDAASLEGILFFMRRIDQEKINKWVQKNKNIDEKEALIAENRELLERNAALESQAGQDKTRNQELQRQLEQLKNIENIIKKRER